MFAGTELPQRGDVPFGRVALMLGEAVLREERVEVAQQAVAMNLCNDRSGRDRRALRVALDNRQLLPCKRTDPNGVRQQILWNRRKRERGEGALHRENAGV